MSTEQTQPDGADEPTEPQPDDARDLPASPTSQADKGDDDPDKDAMGIDDDDPIDKTLVGSPVDDDEGLED